MYAELKAKKVWVGPIRLNKAAGRIRATVTAPDLQHIPGWYGQLLNNFEWM